MNTAALLQGSPEWYKARLGNVTASRISDVVAKGKSGAPSASRMNYMAELIIERLTGERAEHFHSRPMENGKNVEPVARSAYEFLYDVEIKPIGLVMHPTIEESGASPDGLVGDDGGVETKCPNTATHIESILTEKVPNTYLLQMQWQMACTGRKWVDFISFDPRMPADLQLFVKRVERDEMMITSLQVEVRAFLADLRTKMQALLDKVKRRA